MWVQYNHKPNDVIEKLGGAWDKATHLAWSNHDMLWWVGLMLYWWVWFESHLHG